MFFLPQKYNIFLIIPHYKHLFSLFAVSSPACLRTRPRSLTHCSRHPALRGCRPRRAASPCLNSEKIAILLYVLDRDSTCAKIAQVQTEGKRMVKRTIPYFNLDMHVFFITIGQTSANPRQRIIISDLFLDGSIQVLPLT